MDQGSPGKSRSERRHRGREQKKVWAPRLFGCLSPFTSSVEGWRRGGPVLLTGNKHIAAQSRKGETHLIRGAEMYTPIANTSRDAACCVSTDPGLHAITATTFRMCRPSWRSPVTLICLRAASLAIPLVKILQA